MNFTNEYSFRRDYNFYVFDISNQKDWTATQSMSVESKLFMKPELLMCWIIQGLL